MKKIISFALCIVMLFSVVSVCAVAADTPSAKNLMYVKSSAVKDGQVTYTIYLKKNVSVWGGVIAQIGFDNKVLQPVSGGSANVVNKDGDENPVVPGIYVNGLVYGTKNRYSIGFMNGNLNDSYKTGSADKAFMQITFKVIDSNRPVTKVDFYCVEFSSSDENMNITKNETNPQKFATVSTDTVENPVIVSAKPVANGMQVTWKAVPGAAYYNFYKKTSDGWKATKISASKTSYVDTTAKHNVKETYAVKAFRKSGDTYKSPSAYNNITSLYVAPTAKVTAANAANGVKISWSAVSAADSYRLYKRVVKADGTKTAWEKLVAATTAKSYVDKKAANGTKYEYVIRVNVNGVYSGESAIAKVVYYTAPTVKVGSVSGGVKISWNTIKGAKTYNVYRKYSGDSSWTLIKTVKAGTLSFTDAKATSGKKIDYAVKAIAADGSSNYVAKRIDYLATPKLTSLKNGTNGLVLSWGAVKGATTYKVYRKASGETSWTGLAVVKTTSYTDKTVSSGKTYTYTVKAFYGKNYGGSDSKGISLKYLAMPKITKITNASTGINIKWGTVAGASSGYKVYRKASGEKSWTYLGVVKTTGYTDTKVSNGKTYTYTVKAASGSNYSAYNTKGVSLKRVK